MSVEWIESGGPLSPESLANSKLVDELKAELFKPWNLYRVLSVPAKYKEGLRQLEFTPEALKVEAEQLVQNSDRIDSAVRELDDAYSLLGLLLRPPATTRTVAAVPRLRLRLLGAATKALLGGALPTPKGRLLLAAMILLPAEDHWDYSDILKALSLDRDAELVKQVRTSLTILKDAGPLRMQDGIADVLAALSNTANKFGATIQEMGMPLDGRILTWSNAASKVSPAPLDPWAALSQNELVSVGQYADHVIGLLLQAAKEKGVAIDSSSPELNPVWLWSREVHMTGWWDFPKDLSRRITTAVKECTAQLEATSSARGRVLLHLLILAIEGKKLAGGAAKLIGLPGDMLKAVEDAYKQAQWAFFHDEADAEPPAFLLGVSRGAAPKEPESLCREAQALIAHCRERAIAAASAAIPPEDRWIVEVAFSGAPVSSGTRTAAVLNDIRESIVRPTAANVASLNQDERYELAMLGKQYDVGTDSILESIIEQWAIEVQRSFKAEGAARTRANQRLVEAKQALIQGGTATNRLARALREKNSAEFEVTPVLRATSPLRLGQPNGVEKWRRLLISRRALALLFVVAVLGWLGVTYLAGAPASPRAASTTSVSIGTSRVFEDADWVKVNDVWVLKDPVDAVLFHAIAATTVPRSQDGTAQSVTFREAKQWCKDFEAIVRAQSPSLFERTGRLHGLSARLPFPSECEAIGSVPEEWVDRGNPRGAVASPAASLSGQELAALGVFRVVFGPASTEKTP